VVPILNDVENFFMNLNIKKSVLPYSFNNYSLLANNVSQNISLYSKSLQFYAVVDLVDKGPHTRHSIDKLANLADSRRYSRYSLIPYRMFML
jgi:hypothetical protein